MPIELPPFDWNLVFHPFTVKNDDAEKISLKTWEKVTDIVIAVLLAPTILGSPTGFYLFSYAAKMWELNRGKAKGAGGGDDDGIDFSDDEDGGNQEAASKLHNGLLRRKASDASSGVFSSDKEEKEPTNAEKSLSSKKLNQEDKHSKKPTAKHKNGHRPPQVEAADPSSFFGLSHILPNEMKLHVASFLPLKDLVSLRLISHTNRDLADTVIMDRAKSNGFQTVGKLPTAEEVAEAIRYLDSLFVETALFCEEGWIPKQFVVQNEDEEVNLLETLKKLRYCTTEGIVQIFTQFFSAPFEVKRFGRNVIEVPHPCSAFVRYLIHCAEKNETLIFSEHLPELAC